MIDGLVCAGDWAMIGVPPVGLQVEGQGPQGRFLLQRGDGDTWLTAGAGAAFPCEAEWLPTCEAFGVDTDLMTVPLPIPPWGLIGAHEHDLNPIEVTAEVRGLTDGDRTPVEIMASVAGRVQQR